METPDFAIIERHHFNEDLYGLSGGSGRVTAYHKEGVKTRTAARLGPFDLMLFLAVAGYQAQAWCSLTALGVTGKVFSVGQDTTHPVDVRFRAELGLTEEFISENADAFGMNGLQEHEFRDALKRPSHSIILSGSELARAMGREKSGPFYGKVKQSIEKWREAALFLYAKRELVPDGTRRGKKKPGENKSFFGNLMTGEWDAERKEFNFGLNPLQTRALVQGRGFRMVSLATLRAAENDAQRLLLHFLYGRLSPKREGGYEPEVIRRWLYGHAAGLSPETIRQQRARAKKCALSLDGLGPGDGRHAWQVKEDGDKIRFFAPAWPHKRVRHFSEAEMAAEEDGE